MRSPHKWRSNCNYLLAQTTYDNLMTLFYPVTNESFLTLPDLLPTDLDRLSDDFNFDYTDTSDKAVSMDV